MITKSEIQAAYEGMRNDYSDPASWASAQGIDKIDLIEFANESVDDFRNRMAREPMTEAAWAMGFAAGFELAKKQFSEDH